MVWLYQRATDFNVVAYFSCCLGIKRAIKNDQDYVTKLVVESRHLGAFEKSFLALQQIVKFLWTQNAQLEEGESGMSLSSLPEVWIDKVLCEVGDPEGAKKFCLTRRSAGVPRYLEVRDFISKGFY